MQSPASLFIVAILLGPVEGKPNASNEVDLTYPLTRRVEQVDSFHGVEVPDPYRWLEADVREAQDVRDWIQAQNKITQRYLNSIPQRNAIRSRLTELWNYPKYSAPFERGGKYFYFHNDGLQNQSALYVTDALDAEPQLLIDPNDWSADGTIALTSASPSDNAIYLAYTASEAGSDWKTLRILHIASNKLLDDHLKWIRWGRVQWTSDSKGFYYARYPEPKEGQQYQALALNQMIYYHLIGTPQSDDVLVYRRPDHPEWSFSLQLSDDDQFLIIETTKSTDDQNMVIYRRADQPEADWKELITDFDNEFSFVGNQDSTFFFFTDFDAPTKRIVTMSLERPGRDHVEEVVAAAPETLRSANILNGQIVASYLKDATTRVRIYSLSGESVRDVQFPGVGTAVGFSGDQDDTETFFTFSSFDTPSSVYHYDLRSGESELWRRPDVDFDPDAFRVQQVFFTSADGTRVPMFLAHRQGIKLDGNNPTLLYGYGGFNIPITPRFSVTYIAWMEMGGVVAIPNLRGGGEYGESWHVAGKTVNKQNVFDDFIAAAEWLIDRKYTRPKRLAVQGRSNGGLLVGAVMTQRPELFGACLPAVGVMDMLRYQHFTAGRFWVDEYGTTDNEEQFRALLKYSPYHNLKPQTYPPTLVATADTDDRVVPMHSFKFISALQHAQQGEAPVLIRIETRAGHGAGTPTRKKIDDVADHLSFLVKTLGVDTKLNE